MEQFQQLDYVMLILLTSMILSVILSWFSLRIAPDVGLMDIPGSADHKNHTSSIPLTGGVVLMDTMIVMMLITGLWKTPDVWAILVAGLTIGAFGLLDDFIHLSPTKKLIGQLVGSVILIYLGVQVNIFNSPEFFYRTESTLDMWLNLGFTVLWLVTLTNAFNFIDSSDGLAVGLSGLSAAFFLVISLTTGQTSLIFFCAILLGICIGLYFFNSHPARLFLGDSGAQTLGFLLAAVAILYNPNTGIQSSTWFVPILIFYVPLFDLMLVVVSRLRRNKRIQKASRDHTYHRLADRGIPIHHSVLIMHGVSLIMSMVGYLCLNLPILFANIVFCLALSLGVAAFIELDKDYL
jgi:UDP-GlcNAc:undecaprenyl-phosphate GlcNAc-1-phosphate transferase